MTGTLFLSSVCGGGSAPAEEQVSSRGEVCFGLHPEAESISITSASACAPQGKSWETTSTHPASLPRDQAGAESLSQRGTLCPRLGTSIMVLGTPPSSWLSQLVGGLLPPGAGHKSSEEILVISWTLWVAPTPSRGPGLPSPGSCGGSGVVNSLGAWPLNLHSRPGGLRVMPTSPKSIVHKAQASSSSSFRCPQSDTVDMSDWGWTGQGQGPWVTALHTWGSS